MQRFYLSILSLILFFFSGCQNKVVPQRPPTNVTAFKVEPNTVPVSAEFVGVAQSSHLVEIRSRVEGYLYKIDYVEGSFVNTGDLLFEIDPRQFIAAVDEAKGELEKQQAILWAAKQAVSRYRPLYEQKAASKRDLDDAVANELSAEASVAMATAKLQEAKLNLSYTAIVSPIPGLTGQSKYREGTLITPSINGLLTYVDAMDPMWVIFSISDSYLLVDQTEIQNNQLIYPQNNEFVVTLLLSDGSQFPYSGKMDFASPALDPNTGTMTIRAVFPNPNNQLRPGQFVRAKVSGATRPNAIIVPQSSVQQGSKGMYVYVINSENQAELRLVQVGDWVGDYWIIKMGLQKDDLVVVSGVNKVGNGMPVKVTEILPYPKL